MKGAKTLGILGAGQLALMLSEAAKGLSLKTLSFSGSIQDKEALHQFFNAIDFTTFESDFLNYDLLAEFSLGRFRPKLKCLEILRDKLEQKNVLTKLGIKVSPSKILSGRLNLSELSEIEKELGGALVIKWARGGYDGNGVFIYKNNIEKLNEFILEGKKRGYQVFAERKIPYKNELALVSARSIAGDFISYPLVISEQDDGICKNVYGPATKLGIDSSIESLAKDWATKFAEFLDLTGTFALEFFWDGKELWVNEIAPRVHNSGHFSLGASETSQFENHWRALLGLDLGSTKSASIFGMRNLLGLDKKLKSEPPILDFGAESYFKWYDKKESRLRRKLGHITMWSESNNIEALKSRLESAENDWRKTFFESV